MIYQLSLDIFDDECKDWVYLNTEDKVNDINFRIVQKINDRCGHNTTNMENGIINNKGGFKCRDAHDDHVVYNVHLLHTAKANVTKLVACMYSWVSLTTTISVNQAEYSLDKACSGVLIYSDSNPFICPWKSPKSKTDVGLIGLTIALGTVLSLFIIGTIIVGVIVKKRY